MAKQIDPPGADPVQIALAVEVAEPDAVRADNGDDGQSLMTFHLGAGVPDGVEAALQPVLVITHICSMYSD